MMAPVTTMASGRYASPPTRTLAAIGMKSKLARIVNSDVVLAPDRALRPKSGMIYTGSFWARADQAGKAMFNFARFKAMEAVTPQSSTVPASAG